MILSEAYNNKHKRLAVTMTICEGSCWLVNDGHYVDIFHEGDDMFLPPGHSVVPYTRTVEIIDAKEQTGVPPAQYARTLSRMRYANLSLKLNQSGPLRRAKELVMMCYLRMAMGPDTLQSQNGLVVFTSHKDLARFAQISRYTCGRAVNSLSAERLIRRPQLPRSSLIRSYAKEIRLSRDNVRLLQSPHLYGKPGADHAETPLDFPFNDSFIRSILDRPKQ